MTAALIFLIAAVGIFAGWGVLLVIQIVARMRAQRPDGGQRWQQPVSREELEPVRKR